MIRNPFLFLEKYQLFLLFTLSVFLSFNIHSKDKIPGYHHVIWADGAGYYMYLPAAFQHGFNSQIFPSELARETGDGFQIDTIHNKFQTKYTYGVALLQSPFYLGALLIQKINGENGNGFEPIFYYANMIAGVAFGIFGLFFLKRFLLRKYSILISALSILFIFLSTHLFYYTIDKTSYAHVYLFFLFSFLIYHTDRFIKNPSFRNQLLLFIPLFLAILIRPTSIFIIPLLLFLETKNMTDAKSRIHFLKNNFIRFIPSILVASLIFLPQLIYWNYVSGSLVSYSYGEEGFSHLSQPKIWQILFSTNNGLFLYCPLILILISVLLITFRKNFFHLVLLLVFFIITYLFASWHDWTFGCSFGSRSYVEYLAFFAIILAFSLSKIYALKQNFSFILFCCILTYLGYVNVKSTYLYDDCFYGGTWDYEKYLHVFKLI